MLRIVALVIAGLCLCFGLWVWSLVWPVKDYAAEQICSASDIHQTYEALTAARGFQDATFVRLNREAWRRPHVLNLRSHLERAVNLQVDMTFGRRATAAFLCNHADLKLDETTALPHLPDVVAYIATKTGQQNAWSVATCMALAGANRSGPSPPERLLAYCHANPARR